MSLPNEDNSNVFVTEQRRPTKRMKRNESKFRGTNDNGSNYDDYDDNDDEDLFEDERTESHWKNITTTTITTSTTTTTNHGGGGSSNSINDIGVSSKFRTSSLPSPTLALTGHKGSIYSLQYSPSGDILCSTSFDRTCLLWDHNHHNHNHHKNESSSSSSFYENFNVLSGGHTNAILDCSWCDNETIVTVSADTTVQLWDVTTGQRLRKWMGRNNNGHTSIVNSCSTNTNTTLHGGRSATTNTIATGSDDGTCRLWDRRQKLSAGVLETEYPILATSITTTTTTTSHVLYTAGIDPNITCWDLRLMKKIYAMKGHTEPVTSLAIHPLHPTHLISNSMDQTIRLWNIQPFVSSFTTTVGGSHHQRHVKTFTGHSHNSERGLLKCCWNNDGTMISAGSADKMVHIWDEYTTEELYLLPGHKGCVNAVTFHPVETNVIASGGSDNVIYVGELS